MFDIGFPELMLVLVVALLVIGPSKLPETIRTVAFYVGRIRRSLTNLRNEIENEIGADEIRQQLYNESIMDELNQAKGQVQDVINEANNATEMAPLSKNSDQMLNRSSGQALDKKGKAPEPDPNLTDELPQAKSNNDNARSGT